MATNADLEAAIEHDPDDEHAYLVYADWLQTQGDPRGELIALQAAQLRAPADPKLAGRIAELLARHDAALLGELGGEMEVGWHLGFVRAARLAPDRDPAKPVAALRALLAHPSGRFVRSISFAQTRGVDPKQVIRLLKETRRPATLAELHINATFDIETDAPELLTLFPRLHRSLDVEWQRIVKTLAGQRATDLKFEIAKLPRLEPLPDADVGGVSPDHVLLGLKLEIDRRKPLGIVAAIKRAFTAASIDQFVIALGQQFMQQGGPASMKWGFLAIGRLGGDASAAWIASHLGAWSHARAVQGAELLGEIRTPPAIWELHAMIADPALNRPRREDAARTLARIADERGLRVDELLDRTVPAVVHETGKRARIRDAAIRRLEADMIDGRRIPARVFVHYVARHPVMAPLARRLLWATYAGADVETTFRIDADGKALDAAGDPVELEGARVGVLHLAELPAKDRRGAREAWHRAFADPLFPQLDRTIHALRDGDTGEAITRFKLRSVGFDQLRTFEHVLDWAPDQEDNDGGALTIGWSRDFRRDNVRVHAAVDGGAIGRVTATRDRTRVRFEALHPVTVSEILAALERATTRERAAPATEDSEIAKGTWVQVAAGPHRLREGAVFWIGGGTSGPRVGIKTPTEETLWVNLCDVVPTTRSALADAPAVVETALEDHEAPPPRPALEKGMQVRWAKGRHRGTGVVFWIGPNKFGDGMRAGVKDDGTGETMWADADDCQPT